MDTLSHGLYGGVLCGKKTSVSYWKAFLYGIAPDIFSFGILFAVAALNFVSGPSFAFGPKDPSSVPEYIHMLYNLTHSLVISALIIGFVWYVCKKRIVEMFAWPLHILVDIPTHSIEFFPTPFLWPLSDVVFDGVSWSTPWVYAINVVALVLLYIWFWIQKRKK